MTRKLRYVVSSKCKNIQKSFSEINKWNASFVFNIQRVNFIETGQCLQNKTEAEQFQMYLIEEKYK